MSSVVERAAVVAGLEQQLPGGQNWDRMFARIVDEVCEPELRAALLTDREMYRELELLVFEQIAGELEVA